MDQDWAIGDFELLDAIDAWAKGNLEDFDLLDLIDFWAAGGYQWDPLSRVYKAGYYEGNLITLKYDHNILEGKWKARIQSFLDADVIPLIDLESSLSSVDGMRYLEDVLPVMDAEGVALIAFDGHQAPKQNVLQTGYRWSYYIHKVVNTYAERFVLATNGGTNNNWFQQKKSYIGQLEQHVRGGNYSLIGEIEFRHYMSSRQCADGRTDRDINIPIDSVNGHRIFSLSQETGIPFVVHLEPEDTPLDALEEMLSTYPNAKIIVAHFGQIRHPEKETRFSPELIRRLLNSYPNLYYDISTGHPGRRYACNNNVLDTVIWQDDGSGSQTDTLKPEYRDIFTEFSDRFVAGFDYGGGRAPLPEFISLRTGNVRLIMRDLPDEAKHNIGYRNAWFLLTGTAWQ